MSSADEAILESERLRLEPQVAAHAALTFAPLQDPALYDYLAADPPRDPAALAQRYAALESRRSPDGRETWLNWILFERRGAAALGYVQASVRGDGAALGYVLFTPWWGRGYMREAVGRVLAALAARGVREVRASADTRNAGSVAVLEALGFERIATVRSDERVRAGPGDDHRFRLRLPPGQAPTTPAG